MTTIGTWLHTKLRGQLVGEDEFGNRYFEHKYMPKKGRRERWVLYKGIAEASKVPAHWHRWLHYTTDTAPRDNNRTHDWEKQHIPNLTGTAHAYVPQGHLRKGGKRYRVSADYEPWKP